MIDDLDLVGSGPEARERVDEPLETVVGLDDLLRRPLGERVRLVVEDERPFAGELEDVEPAVEEDAVMDECERPLRADAGEAADGREIRARPPR